MAEEMEPSACSFWLKKKRRTCGFPRVPESQFCSQHAERDCGFVPCPLDPRHRVQEGKLEQHVRVCNKAKAKRQMEALPYYVKDVAVLRPGVKDAQVAIKSWSLEQVQGFVARIQEVYMRAANAYRESTGEELPPITVPRAPKPDKRQHIQSQVLASLLERNNLLNSDLTYIEFGAGKGALSHYIAERVSATHILIERAPMRNKYDKQHKSTFIRLQADIADIDLRKVELRSSVVCVGKHVCGGATDLALTSTLRVRLHGLALATCCHHCCSLSTFVGTDVLTSMGVGEEEIVCLFKASSWGPSGAIKVEEENKEMSLIKSEAGLKAKRIIDISRVLYLRNNGLQTRLAQYCDNSLTPENMVILGISSSQH